MGPRLIGGTATPALLARIAGMLGVVAEECRLERFPDGELHVELGRTQRGEHVFIVQPTCPPIDEHLVELVLLADACKRAGAARVTAVVPYFGYARQDRRSTPGEAIGAKAVARLVEAAGIDQLVAVDPLRCARDHVRHSGRDPERRFCARRALRRRSRPSRCDRPQGADERRNGARG